MGDLKMMRVVRAIKKSGSMPHGRGAATTMKRKLTWEEIIWPLILKNKTTHFTWEEYKKSCLEYYKVDRFEFIHVKVVGPFTSLIEKGIIKKQEKRYSIDHRLVSYLRLCKKVSYGLAARISTTKD